MRILIVDDDAMIRKALAAFLGRQLGHEVVQSENGLDALELFGRHPFHLVIADIRMPGMDGIELLRKIKGLREGSMTDVVIVTGHGDMSTAIQALRAGAYDYLLKPPDIEHLALLVERVAEHQSLLRENYEYRHHFEEKFHEAARATLSELESFRSAYAEVIGIGKIGIFSDTMRSIVAMAEQFHGDRSVPVLIEGETGTGKEIVARLVHYGHEAVTTPFVSINCSALSPGLFESELFGYEGGAFTGAKSAGMMGKLESANGGTIFLDEIGDIPPEQQPKLLRAIEEREIYRVGGVKKIHLDVRFVCATNRDLKRLVREGHFRSDLFYRLNTGSIYIPPLRERQEEIALLAQLFLEHYAEQKKRRFRYVGKDSLRILERYPWPGNVRELENTIERIVLIYDGIEVTPDHLRFLSSDSAPIPDQDFPDGNSITITLPPDRFSPDVAEAKILKKALSMFNGNKTRTAQYLGMSLSTLKRKIIRYCKDFSE